MMSDKKLLIVIPAYNEEENITPVIEALKKIELPVEKDILVINDGSSDRTAEIVHNLGIKHITNVINLGYGGCLQVGYKYAFREKYDYLVQMDADGQHDPCNVEKIYEALVTGDENGKLPDIVLGSRFMNGSADFPAGTLKKIAWWWFKKLLRLFTGIKHLSDPTTGLQGLSRSAICFYSYFGHFDGRYPDANMIEQMALLGFRITQIPAVMHIRTSGTSMHSGLVKPFFYMFHMTISMIAVWIRVKFLHIDIAKANRIIKENRED